MGSRGLVITPSTSPRTRQATQVTISAMFSLKALTLLVTAASLAQAHSLDKRETTVSEFLSRSAPAISRTIAGIGLTDVLLVVGGFIALDILFTLGLVFFTTAGGKRSSSQSGFFGWGLPSFSGLYRNVSHMYNSLDIVDMAFNYPVAKLAINTLNSSFKGLEKYQHAVIAGQNGEDCSLLYSQCPVNYFGLKY